MKLSNLLKHTFYKYPLDHSLNINNFEKFIDACDPKVREICIILLQNTIHISFETFLISLNSNINDLLSKVNSKHCSYFVLIVQGSMFGYIVSTCKKITFFKIFSSITALFKKFCICCIMPILKI